MQERTLAKKELQNLSSPLGEEKIDLRDIFYTLLAEKWIIIAATIFMGIIGLYQAIIKIPQYKVDALLQIENKSGGRMGMLDNLSLAGANTNFADVQIALIKSRFVLSSALEALNLDVSVTPKYYPFFGEWYAKHHSKKLHPSFHGLNQYAWGGEKIKVAQFQVPLEYQGKTFKLVTGKNHSYELFTPENKLFFTGKVGQVSKIKQESQEFTILIKTLEANPGTEFYITKQFMGNVANSIASQLQITDLGDLNQLNKTGVLQMSLTGPDPQRIVDLVNAIAVSAQEKDRERKSSEVAKTLEFLEKQLPLVSSALDSVEAELTLYRQKTGTIDLTLRSKLILGQLANIQKNIEKITLNRLILLQKLTPIHPIILGLNEEKAALQKEIESLERQLQELPASDQTAVKLMRDIKVKGQLYFLLLHKIQELHVAKEGTISDIRILSLATIPNSSLPVGRLSILLTWILFGVVLGIGIVVVRKWLHRYVEDPNWLEQHFGIPTFAIVPYSNTQKEYALANKESGSKSLYILAQTQPRDLTIESLRSLRTSLQFALIGAKNNIISVMGMSPGIGKSFIAVNFTQVLVDSGKRVLLIDGDIRKGYLQDYFHEARSPGLSELVAGGISLENAIRKTQSPNLYFLPSGKFPPNPSELLLSETFKNLLSILSTQYDLIVIDTPPVLAVTDSAIISSLSGVNFMVLGASKHQAEEINLGMKRLESNSVRVHGVIFNYTSARKTSTQQKFNYQYEYTATT